jgi:hypothetical protein
LSNFKVAKAYRATEIITPAGGLNLEAPVAESPEEFIIWR